MRVLIIAVGSHGDVLPFIALGQEFQRRGQDPVLYSSPAFAPLADAAGIPFKALGSLEYYRATLRDLDLNHPTRVVRIFAEVLERFARITFDAMMADFVANETVVVASTLAFVARSVAGIRRAPSVTVHLSPFVFRSTQRLPRRSEAVGVHRDSTVAASTLSPTEALLRSPPVPMVMGEG